MASTSASSESIWNQGAQASTPSPQASEPAPAAQTGNDAQASGGAVSGQPEAKPSAMPAQDEDAVEAVVRAGGKQVPLEVALAERKKRQTQATAHAAELAELRGRAAAYEQQLASFRGPPQAAPSAPVVDEEGEFFTKPLNAIDGRIDRKLADTNKHMALAVREIAKAQFQDFGEHEAKFFEVAKSNPEMMRRMLSLPPAEQPMFAYKTGKQLSELKGATSIEEIRAQERQALTVEIEAKLRKELALGAAAQASTSTAGARSVGNAPTVTGPASVTDAFPNLL